MLKFNENQNQLQPLPNNCSGGLALAAVLGELSLGDNVKKLVGKSDNLQPLLRKYGLRVAHLLKTPPLGVSTYIAIQEAQSNYKGIQEKAINDSNTVRVGNGTKITLPSAIINTAIKCGVKAKDVSVHIDQKILLKNDFIERLIDAEISSIRKLGVLVHKVNSNIDLPLVGDNLCQIVLCEQGNSWVAQNKEGIYNPATGKNNEHKIERFVGLWVEFSLEKKHNKNIK